MKASLLPFAILLALVQFTPAQNTNNTFADAKPLPTMDFVLQQVVNRAVTVEDKNDNLFDMNYKYTRTRVWEYRNSSGELKSREEKSSVENKPQRMAARAAKLAAENKPAPPPPAVKDGPVTETRSNIRGKALKVKDYSIPNLVKRFQFTVV